jgi:DNA recombination protein RmuC
LRTLIDDLSTKAYLASVHPTPEFVLLFLSIEALFGAVLEADPSLIQDSIARRVIIVTPTTLIALLKAVVYGWRQEKLTVYADEVGKLGEDIYDRLSLFTTQADISNT